MDSLVWPNVVAVSAFSTFSLDLALALTSATWCRKVAPRSRVTPRSLVVGSTGMREPQKGNPWFHPVLPIEGCDEGNGGLLWGYRHPVGGEPLLQPVEILLQVVGSSIHHWMLGNYCKVVSI